MNTYNKMLGMVLFLMCAGLTVGYCYFNEMFFEGVQFIAIICCIMTCSPGEKS